MYFRDTVHCDWRGCWTGYYINLVLEVIILVAVKLQRGRTIGCRITSDTDSRSGRWMMQVASGI